MHNFNYLKKQFVIFFLLLSGVISASHNRSGEIIYERIPPYTSVVSGVTVPTYNYRITVIRYTDDGTTSSAINNIADRCEDTIYFGDGQHEVVARMNGGTPLCAGCVGCGCPNCGELIIHETDYKVKKNIYQTTHMFPGPGTYTIRSFDPNRNADVANIPNSANQPFYIESLLIINPFTGANSSPQFLYDPIDRACVGKCFTHNPGAYDPDGDSLSYELTASRGAGGAPVINYTYPYPGSNGIFNINAYTGLITWCSPQVRAEFNIAFLVKEWRKNIDGHYLLIGYVLRDMQVAVNVCPNNNPPDIILPVDTCVEAGTLIHKKIKFSDPDPGNFVTLLGNSGVFSAPSPAASLNNTSGTIVSTGDSFLADFSWQTTCDHIRRQPYQTTFKAFDNGLPNELATYKTYSIKVIPPAIKHVTATPIGSSIRVSWDLTLCNPAGNPLVAYKIYRKNDCSAFAPAPCQTGLPISSGFTFIGQTNAGTSFFIDSDGGNGLVVGQDYSYSVLGIYNDSTETIGGSQVCTKLKRDVPLILNVDVRSTSNDSGSVYIHWINPLTNTGNFDTLAFPGPYTINLNYRENSSQAYTTVFTSVNAKFLKLDTAFIHTGINTISGGKEYSLDFISGNTLVGSSHVASSVFLITTPGDRKVKLQWASNTPWNNTSYSVWRKNPAAAAFTQIASVTGPNYTDSATASNSIVNHNTYCYKILSEGSYSDPTIIKPLLNFSEEACAKVTDLTPPCAPTLTVEADCPTGFVKVSWNDVRTLPCGDDVISYILYYKPTIDDEYQSIAVGTTTSYVYDGLTLVSGCYALQAKDSSNNVSPMSPDFCIDNCPVFELPNVFSPNKDGINEFFKAIRVRQIKDIDMSVFDRWGNLVYKTTDPYFNWDGVSILTKEAVSEGTFFYICNVFESRLKGTFKRTLKGFVQVVR